MLKKSTLLFIGTFFLLFIGVSDYGYADHKDKPHGGGGGGGGNGGGDGLTANLTGGTFVFDAPLPVTLNRKGNSATSEEPLNMKRPDGGSERLEWDAVFDECQMTLDSLEIPVDEIDLGDDDWKIAAGAGDIRLRLFDIRLDAKTLITLELRGVPDYSRNPIPPDDNGISQFVIDGWVIFGDMEKGVTPRDSCKLFGDFSVSPSTLSICGEAVNAEDCH